MRPAVPTSPRGTARNPRPAIDLDASGAGEQCDAPRGEGHRIRQCPFESRDETVPPRVVVRDGRGDDPVDRVPRNGHDLAIAHEREAAGADVSDDGRTAA